MRIAILSFFNEHNPGIADETAQSLKDYCSKWGYTPHLGRPFEHPDTAQSYSRFLFAYLLCKAGNDAVMWVSPHALITNHYISIEDRLGDEQFVVGFDGKTFSADVFIARNTVATRELLYSVYEGGEHVTGKQAFPESATLTRYLEFAQYKKTATALPRRMMHAGDDWEPGDWIRTLPVSDSLTPIVD